MDMEKHYAEIHELAGKSGLGDRIKYFKDAGILCINIGNPTWMPLITTDIVYPLDGKIKNISIGATLVAEFLVLEYEGRTITYTYRGNVNNIYGADVRRVHDYYFILHYEESGPIKYNISNNVWQIVGDEYYISLLDARADKMYKFVQSKFYGAYNLSNVNQIKHLTIINFHIIRGENIKIDKNAIIIGGKAHYIVADVKYQKMLIEYETGKIKKMDTINDYLIKSKQHEKKLYFNNMYVPISGALEYRYWIYLIDEKYILSEINDLTNEYWRTEVFPINIAAPKHTKAAIRLEEPEDAAASCMLTLTKLSYEK